MDVILHGTWAKGESDKSSSFLVWGEQRLTEISVSKPEGRSAKIAAHPYAVSSVILKDVISELSESLKLDDFSPEITEGEAILTLPVIGKTPLPSRRTAIELEGEIRLSDCKVSAIYLLPSDAVKILSSIPHHTYDLPYDIGTDIRFWSVAAKFALHLISQQRFLPALREKNGDFIASWEPVLDDPSDVQKIDALTRSMPDSCRSVKSILIYTRKGQTQQNIAETRPGSLVLDFLNTGIDEWVRVQAKQNLLPKSLKSLKDKAVIRWLTALTEPTGEFQSKDLRDDLRELCRSLAVWRGEEKDVHAPMAKLRACFRLEPPEVDSSKWVLRYFLQALDDPSLLIPADALWKERKATLRYLNREFDSPQEQMLAGLGTASRMFPPIEGSLRQARPDMCQLDLNEAYQFLNETSLLLQQNGFGVLAPPWWTEKRSAIKANISVSAPKTESSGIISLDSILVYNWQIALGDETITPEELERLASLKVPLVKMRGQWVLLRPEDIKSAVEFLKKHNESQEISFRDIMKLSLSDTPDIEGIRVEKIESPQWLNLLIADLKAGSMKQLKQPKDMTGKLRPYQLSGLSWLAFMRQWGFGACLADDMGLGKTIEMIALLLHEKKQRKGKSVPNLLICPTSVVGNWQREIARFAPSLKAMLHHGGERASGEEFAKSVMDNDLVITSYGLARRDVEDITAVDWKNVILDEAQNIKNPSSKIAQVVRSLKSECRFTLTGTPVENRLMELWSIIEFLNPGYLGSQSKFNQRYVVPIEHYNDERSTKELRSLVAPFVMRRLKTDPKIINDLPEKMEMKVYCNLTREQVTLYEATVKDVIEQIEEKSGIERRGMILSGLMKLKQLCNHPALFLHDKSEIDGRSGKVQRLVEMLEEVISEGDKSLVFTQFAEMGEALQEYLSSKFRSDVLYLHGGVPQKKRDRMVSLFQEDSTGTVYRE